MSKKPNINKDLLQTLHELIRNWEGEIVEFKEASKDYKQDKIGRYFSAISNEANLKALNFKWHMKKSEWYLSPEDYKKRSKKNYELDEIRAMYGTSGEFKSNGTEKLHSA
jgi:hypothetical protein